MAAFRLSRRMSVRAAGGTASNIAILHPGFAVRGVSRLMRPETCMGVRPMQRDNRGVNRIRLSTTVDAALLSSARDVRAGITDAALIDEALGALLARHRSAQVDASYAAYDNQPVDELDEWGDLASWRRAAGNS